MPAVIHYVYTQGYLRAIPLITPLLPDFKQLLNAIGRVDNTTLVYIARARAISLRFNDVGECRGGRLL